VTIDLAASMAPLPGAGRARPGAGRRAAFWAVTVLIALLVPSPIAAPIVYARLRRGPSPVSTPGA
jgi:hypothetical protein